MLIFCLFIPTYVLDHLKGPGCSRRVLRLEIEGSQLAGSRLTPIIKLFDAYFECYWILGDRETEYTNVFVL